MNNKIGRKTLTDNEKIMMIRYRICMDKVEKDKRANYERRKLREISIKKIVTD